MRVTDHRRPGYPFEKLRVWQQAHALTLTIYRLSANFPKDEQFGLTSQLRRAASSIGANIAEGSKRDTVRDYAHFLNMAEGSTAESKNFLLLARDLEYLNRDAAAPLLDQIDAIGGMLYRLRAQLDNGPAVVG